MIHLEEWLRRSILIRVSSGPMVYEELIKSLKGSGKHLLFTCACGVADDGGWNGVDIKNDDITISWEIDRNTHDIAFTFEFNQYQLEQEKLISEVNNLSQAFSLEPTHVNFPEEW